jgi:hypothetical protein
LKIRSLNSKNSLSKKPPQKKRFFPVTLFLHTLSRRKEDVHTRFPQKQFVFWRAVIPAISDFYALLQAFFLFEERRNNGSKGHLYVLS